MKKCHDPLPIGAQVVVRAGPPEVHCRTPFYLRGKQGEVMEFLGLYRNPSLLAFNKPGLPSLKLYRVRFPRRTLWPHIEYDGPDSVIADLYEHWLISNEGDTDE